MGFICRCAEKAQHLGYDLIGVQFYGKDLHSLIVKQVVYVTTGNEITLPTFAHLLTEVVRAMDVILINTEEVTIQISKLLSSTVLLCCLLCYTL